MNTKPDMSENEIKPVYPKIDHMQLDADGGYYCRHVAAMTDESLHRKSDIAGQLGMRDREIDRLTAERDAAVAEVAKMEALVAAAKRARRCLAWACEQRPEFNAEYEAFNEAIDAARAEGGV